MKRLLNILLVLIALTSCNFTAKEVAKKKEIKNETPSSLEKIEEVKQQEKKMPIEQFLHLLKTAVEKDDVVAVENCLQFPFEFNSGGESSFYNNYSEIKEECDRFSYILKANSIEKEDELLMIIYQDPEDIEYFVAFYVEQKGNSFKLTGFSQPH